MVRAIDLFAGAGGLSLGLIEAGVDVVAAVEWDHDAAETYRLNIGDHMIEADIMTIDPDDLPECDLIAGGPPCQGFSYAGKRDPDDPRNRLWEHYLRIVDAKRPAFVLIENVPGILRSVEHHGIVNALANLGYHATVIRLNAVDHGVPQRRKRVFYIANSIGIANPVPMPTHVDTGRRSEGQTLLPGFAHAVTVRQALGIGGQMTHKYSVTDRLASDGRTSPWYDGDHEPARSISHEPHKLVIADRGLEHHWLADQYDVAPTIQCDSRVSKPGHHGPGEPRMMLRRLTPEECAVLQDFPPGFVFTGSKSSKHRQIGNAVPRGLARAIGTVIRTAWEAV